MNKKNALTTAAVVVAIIIFSAIIATFCNPQPATATVKLPEGEPPQWQITVTGNVKEQKTLTLKQITQMPLNEVKAAVNGENATYQGVTLFDFCNNTDMLWDAGPIDVTGAGGQKATINIFQAWNSTTYPYYQNENRITLVFAKNGQWMTETDGGPVRLIAPCFASACQIEQVNEIHVGKWAISVSGAVSNPLSISSENLTSFQEETVQAEFAPSDGKRTSNWTGLSVASVLQAAGSHGVEKVSFVAIDGYVKNYTFAEVEEAHMLIGYEENGQHLTQDAGGPYRLFCTVDKYKWAQFWAKFISKVIVY